MCEKGKYDYDYLIDCSGNSFFIRKLLKLNLPSKLWIGKTRLLLLNKKPNFQNEAYYCLNDDGTFEDFYPFENYAANGVWRYTDSSDLNHKTPLKNSHFSDIIAESKVFLEKRVMVPANPVFPLHYKNIGFLGDSFGNATTIASEGIRPILDTSKLLCQAIRKNNLSLYDSSWKKVYLNTYLKHLASKNLGKNRHKDRMRTILSLKEHPDAFYNILDSNPNYKFPKEAVNKVPFDIKLKQLIHYNKYKLYYFFQQQYASISYLLNFFNSKV
ncbi:MAG: hypothetical protein V1859_01740 [archaeon]